MDNSIYALASAANADAHKMKVVSNNVANANTGGYKGDSVLFTQYVHDDAKNKTNVMPQDKATLTDFSQGSLRATNAKLDFAIDGNGFFMVQTDSGTRYTRYGSFLVNANGELITQQGHRVLSDGENPILIKNTDAILSLSADGMLYAKMDGGEFEERGRLGISNFNNLASLRKEEGGLFHSTDTAYIVEKPRILQGMIEESNTNTMKEMQNLIEIQRQFENQNTLIKNAYELNSRAYSIMSKNQ